MLKMFAYHKPGPEGLEKITILREAFSTLMSVVEDACPESREKALTRTSLETAAMWAVKAVVINDPASEASL